MTTKLGQENHWCNLNIMMTFTEVKVIRGQMWSTTCYGYQTWSEESLIQVYDNDDLHGGQGHQRSKVVNYMLWLPNLVRRIPDASLKWWWPSWKSKVIKGQMGVNYALWLPYLVKRIPDASLKWWLPSWRSMVICGHIIVHYSK